MIKTNTNVWIDRDYSDGHPHKTFHTSANFGVFISGVFFFCILIIRWNYGGSTVEYIPVFNENVTDTPKMDLATRVLIHDRTSSRAHTRPYISVTIVIIIYIYILLCTTINCSNNFYLWVVSVPPRRTEQSIYGAKMFAVEKKNLFEQI